MAKRNFKPQTPFDSAFKLLKPTTTMVKGVAKKVFPEPADVTDVFYGNFRTYGGSENMSNDVYMVYDTGIINTWYDPQITSDCRVYLCDTGEVYEIINRPENISMRHQYLQFKVQKVGGKP